MIQKLVRSNADFTLNTSIELYMLSIDEVRWIRFKNEEQAQALFKLGQMEEVPPTTPLRKAIPVLYPMLSDSFQPPVLNQTVCKDVGVPMECGIDELLQKMRAKVEKK